MTSSPFFSIIIPTYNRGDLILKTLESVFSQTYNSYEVLVVDNCSTDNTSEILQPLFESQKIRYIKNERNYERAVSRNVGINNAKGEYITFIDSDDIMHNNHLSVLFSIIQNNPSINFIATKYQIIRDQKTHLPPSLKGLKEGWYNSDLFIKGNPLAITFCINRNNPHLKLFLEDAAYTIMEDWIFLFQNIINDKIFIKDIITISLIDHDSRTMRGNNQKIISKKTIATEWIVKNLPLTKKKIQSIWGYSYYFCAIHNYIDDNKLKGIEYLIKATAKIGITLNSIMLLIKILIGYNAIQKLKS